VNRPATTFWLVIISMVITGEAVAGPGESPRAWLERMSSAMSQMTYQGTFVYVQGDDVATMRITHVSDRDGVRERLVSVSGPRREVLRDSNGVRWVLGDDRSVLEDSGFNRTFFPELPLDQREETDRSYTLKFGDNGRIAGFTARNIKIVPRDNYRYGYSLWLEEHSGLLLKWELINSDRKPLAKLMFTEIRIGSEVDPDELRPSSELKKFKTVASELPTGRAGAKSAPRWQPSRLPPGFQLTGHRMFGQQGQGLYEHLIYSDGLAAVSVYVESEGANSGQSPGMSRLGTTHAYSRHAEDILITVVGDVPPVTVEFIAKAVAPASR
jgi:sigma-E factor negative regulatory protein RseB